MFYIYGKPNCVWCDRAKLLLDKNKIEYLYYEIGTFMTLEEFKHTWPEVRSVPLIYDGATRIGGYNDLVAYLPQIDLDNL